MASSTTQFLDQQITARMSRTASDIIPAKRLVAINATDHTLIDLAGANARCNGVAEVAATAGDEIAVAHGGNIVVQAGATIELNDELVSDESGRVIPRGVTADVLYHVIGRALTQAAEDELLTVAWGPYAVWGDNAE